MNFSKRFYKFRKGDTLDKVARGYGHRGTAVIWNHAKNKQIKSKRKTESALEKGDALYIPLNEAEKDQIKREIDFWETEIANEMLLQGNLRMSHALAKEKLYNVTNVHMLVQAKLKETEMVMINAIAVVKKAKEAEKLKTTAGYVSVQVSKAMGKVHELAKTVEKEGAEIKKLAGGELKKVAKAAGISGSDGKSAVGFVSDLADSIGDVASKITKEVSSATTQKYWMDLIFYGDVELLDLDKAKSDTEKRMMKTVNKVRKSKAMYDKIFKGVAATIKINIKYLEGLIANSEKRYIEAGKSLKALPDLKTLKAA